MSLTHILSSQNYALLFQLLTHYGLAKMRTDKDAEHCIQIGLFLHITHIGQMLISQVKKKMIVNFYTSMNFNFQSQLCIQIDAKMMISNLQGQSYALLLLF
jgi:hypothetical protein